MIHLWAAPAATAGGPDVPALLLVLAAVLVTAKLLGEAARRVGQPAVLGELVAGILLGGSVLGVLDPAQPVLHVLSELGVIVLLFAVGLETDLHALRRVGGAAASVGAAGIVLPGSGGYGVALLFGASQTTALVVAAALTATSIGISARVLGDLGRLRDDEGQIVLGAAVLDDIVGLVMLAVVSTVAAGGVVSAFSVARTSVVAVGFLVGALWVGVWAARPLLARVARLQSSGAVGVSALAFALVAAAVAARAGSAMIIGAFAAGLALHGTPQRHEIERWTTSLGHVLVPVFFASVGAQVDVRVLASPSALALGGALIVVAVIGKVLAGFAPRGFEGNRLMVGVAMVPRGEVGLIFAQVGAAAGVLDGTQFGALIAMVVVTTFATPPLLSRVAGPPPPGLGGDEPDSGVNELVGGAAPRAPRSTVPRKRIAD